MKKYKNSEIASNLELWLEYVCGNHEPQLNTEWFYSMEYSERVDHLSQQY